MTPPERQPPDPTPSALVGSVAPCPYCDGSDKVPGTTPADTPRLTRPEAEALLAPAPILWGAGLLKDCGAAYLTPDEWAAMMTRRAGMAPFAWEYDNGRSFCPATCPLGTLPLADGGYVDVWQVRAGAMPVLEAMMATARREEVSDGR